MKICLSILLTAWWLAVAVQNATAQFVTIPDSGFVSWLQDNGYANCMNGNQLDTLCSPVLNATMIDCSANALNDYNIADLTGIEYFTSLDTLFCEGNDLTFLPPLPAGLTNLNCRYNQLQSLPQLPSGLLHLACDWNAIPVLPDLPASLISLSASMNNLTSVPTLPSTLEWLDVGDNNISSIPNLPLTLLFLNCANNFNIQVLPDLPPGICFLDCRNNSLSALPALPLSGGWNQNLLLNYIGFQIQGGLSCGGNNLTALPQTFPPMIRLSCEDNLLTQLPSDLTLSQMLQCQHNQLTSLPDGIAVQTLDCSYNQITALPPLPAAMQSLIINNNPISCIPPITYVGNISISNTNITCLPNPIQHPFSIPAIDTLPICDVNSGCPIGTIDSLNITVSGLLTGTNGGGIQVIVSTGMLPAGDTVTTNPSGLFSSVVPIGNLLDSIFIRFVDCNGVTQLSHEFVTPGTTTVNYTGNYCPNTPTQITVNIHLDNTAGSVVPVTITSALDTLTHFLNQVGDASVPINVSTFPAFIGVAFTDCNGVLQDTVLIVPAGTAAVSYSGDYCPTAGQFVDVIAQLFNATNDTVMVTIATDSVTVTDSVFFGILNHTLPVISYASPVSVSFVNCNGVQQDTAIVPSGTTVLYFADYCPAATVDSCGVLFTATYCTCDTAFTLEMDSAAQSWNNGYLWDFGDGTTSTSQQFPVHTYAQNGIYTVCLTTTNPSGTVCQYCHDIGIDSLGNIVTRTDADGFIIKIVPFGTTGISHVTPDETFDIYPNPVGADGTVSLYSDKAVNYIIRIHNAVGQEMKTISVKAEAGRNNVSLPLHELAAGLYLMTIQFDSKKISRTFVR